MNNLQIPYLKNILRDTDSYPVLSKIEVYGMEKEVVV